MEIIKLLEMFVPNQTIDIVPLARHICSFLRENGYEIPLSAIIGTIGGKKISFKPKATKEVILSKARDAFDSGKIYNATSGRMIDIKNLDRYAVFIEHGIAVIDGDTKNGRNLDWLKKIGVIPKDAVESTPELIDEMEKFVHIKTETIRANKEDEVFNVSTNRSHYVTESTLKRYSFISMRRDEEILDLCGGRDEVEYLSIDEAERILLKVGYEKIPFELDDEVIITTRKLPW